MKKTTAISILLLMALASVLADAFTQMKFLLLRHVEENVMSYVFEDTSGNDYTDSGELAIDLSLDFEDDGGADCTQVILRGTTNTTTPYYVYLTFTPMTDYDTRTNRYLYKARVTTDIGKTLVEFNPTTKADVTINFRGANATDPDFPRTDITYPIEFSFKDYRDSYSSGSYIATITLEIEQI